MEHAVKLQTSDVIISVIETRSSGCQIIILAKFYDFCEIFALDALLAYRIVK